MVSENIFDSASGSRDVPVSGTGSEIGPRVSRRLDIHASRHTRPVPTSYTLPLFSTSPCSVRDSRNAHLLTPMLLRSLNQRALHPLRRPSREALRSLIQCLAATLPVNIHSWRSWGQGALAPCTRPCITRRGRLLLSIKSVRY